MPGGDRSGPQGAGPRTGRAAGYCSGYNQPGFSNPISCRGYWGQEAGGGWSGRGRGWRHRYWATGLTGWMRGHPWDHPMPDNTDFFYPPYSSPEQERKALEKQVDILERHLEETKNRLANLEKS